jgi:hypothetical protein
VISLTGKISLMKKLLVLLLVNCSLFLSCSRSNDPSPNPPQPETLVTYEVITSSGTWFGEYFNDKQQRLYTNDATSGVVFPQPSGWKYTFKPAAFPFQMFCHATTTCQCSGTPTSPDVTINFYVNGILVKSETNNWAKGVTTIVYDIQ